MLTRLVLVLVGLALSVHWVAAAQPALPPDPEPLPLTGNCVRDNVFYGAIPPGGEEGRVLVFVHGLAGLAEDWWSEQTSAGFNDTYALAYQAGYRTAFVNLNVDPEATTGCRVERRPANDMLRNGVVLAEQLEAIVDHYAVERIDVVAHSKGGIDAQTAVVWFGAWRHVRNLFMIATPHQGALVADLLWSPEGAGLADLLGQRDAATFSLRTPLMQLFRFATDPSQLDDYVRYHSGAGYFWNTPDTIYRITGAWLGAHPAGGPNDGVIVVESTQLPDANGLFLQPWNHAQVTIGRNIFPFIHAALLADQTPTRDLSLTGPAVGTVNRDYSFTGILPPDVTTPITYTWQATEQEPLIRAAGSSDTVRFSWAGVGRKQVSVTAENIGGMETVSHEIEIRDVTAPANVKLTGPVIGETGKRYPFSITLPNAPTTPITYTWQATGQPTLVKTSDAVDSINLTWYEPGVKVIRVTMTNNAGTASALHTIAVSAEPAKRDDLPVRQFLPNVQGANGVIYSLPFAPVSSSAESAALAGTLPSPPTVPPAVKGSNYILRGGRLPEGFTQEDFLIEPAVSSTEFLLLTAEPETVAAIVGPDETSIPLASLSQVSDGPLAGAYAFTGRAESPTPGAWQLQVSSPRPGAYLLLSTFESELHVEVTGLSESMGVPGQILALHAESQAEGMDAWVEGMTVTTIAHNGAEVVGAQLPQVVSTGADLRYTVPDQPGLYDLSISVTGNTADGLPFERTFVHPFAVLSSEQNAADFLNFLQNLLGGFTQ